MRGGLAALLALAALACAAPGKAAPGAPLPSRWCGPGESAADLPDTLNNAFQIHVVYAFPADAPDRFGERALPIVDDVAAIDAWWQAQDPTREPRFDLAAFPGCDSELGRLDLSSVRLPEPGAYYADPGTVIERLGRALAADGLADPEKKDLVYYDGPVQEPGGGSFVCGEAPTNVPGGGLDAVAIVFLVPPCGDGLGTATSAAATAAHELIHDLGAVPPQAPHVCPDSPGHVCDSPSDIMYPTSDYGAPLASKVLDVGRDDYYGHPGTWWDVRNSPFLEPVGATVALPEPAAGLTATSSGPSITLTWEYVTSPNGPVTYRLYRDGTLLARTPGNSYTDVAPVGTTHTYVLEPEDALGYLGVPQTIRFTVGAGIVDAAGTQAGDTVPPSAVRTLAARRTRTGFVLRWSAATDATGVLGYRVERNGRPFGPLVKGTALAIARSTARGRWTVAAVDAAGNVGPASGAVSLR